MTPVNTRSLRELEFQGRLTLGSSSSPWRKRSWRPVSVVLDHPLREGLEHGMLVMDVQEGRTGSRHWPSLVSGVNRWNVG